MAEPEADRVECYSGYTYAQEPRIFVWQGQRYAVARVEQRWRTLTGPVFCVRADDGRRFTLTYSEIADTWDVQSVERHSESGR